MDKKKILIIDDEKDLVQLVKLNLERTGLYDVIAAHNGDEGLLKVEKECPDLIVLDVMMPGKDGFEVLKELRKPGVKWRPVIMLTAKSHSSLEAYELKADFYIIKPFDIKLLLYSIEKLLPLISTRIRQEKEDEEGKGGKKEEKQNG